MRREVANTYPMEPAKPLEKEMAAKAEVEKSGVSAKKSATTALFVFSHVPLCSAVQVMLGGK